MRFLLAFVLVLLPQGTEPMQHRIDLEPMLHDADTLKKLTIMHEQPGDHGFQVFFVRGDGSLIVQGYPKRTMATPEVPSCRNKVSQEKIRELVRLFLQKHFWDLPEKRFIFVYASQTEEELELHTIAVDDGYARASRTFGVGTHAGKQESIPADFSAIEEQLNQLKDFTLHTPEKPCHFAPAINFWK